MPNYIFNEKQCTLHTLENTDLLSRSVINKNIWEPKLAFWLMHNIQINTTFFDVGCNIGVHTCHAKLLDCNQIFAYDCNPKVLDCIKKTISENKWENVFLSEFGLSNEEKIVNFMELQKNISASYICDTYEKPNRDIKTMKQVEVKIFNNVFDMNLIPQHNNIIIKLDVEGHELEALEGMTNLLSDIRTKNIIVELNPTTSTWLKLERIIDFLSKYNFTEILEVFNNSKNPWFANKIEQNYNFSTITKEQIKNEIELEHILEVIFSKK